MYSKAGDNFSFQYVETPELPLNHSAPRPLLDTILAFIFANLVAMSVVGAIILWPTGRVASAVGVVCDCILRVTGRLFGRAWHRTGGSADRDNVSRPVN